jgi:tRNA-dihydrouridine synthase C
VFTTLTRPSPAPPPRPPAPSLLKTPHHIERLVSTLVAAVGGAAPVTVKMRSGFHDVCLFEDNLLAAQAGGAAFVTVHPRTKQQAYTGAADWGLIARAKAVLDIPVVGGPAAYAEAWVRPHGPWL